MVDLKTRLQCMQTTLLGLAVGDAFGEHFFVDPWVVELFLSERALPKAPWRVTDDTVMACAIAYCLQQEQCIQEDSLARQFALHYSQDPGRGYGGTAFSILRAFCLGEAWKDVSSQAFNGTGSMGNGGAMRSGPLGAFFFDQPEIIVIEAQKSARVTHWHPEGQAGAVAIALAAAWATSVRMGHLRAGDTGELFDFVLRYLPTSTLRIHIEHARECLAFDDVAAVVQQLGNGSRILALDTVPFTLWAAEKYMHSYEKGMWETVSALGDRDTNCAIVGAIVASFLGRESIPKRWIDSLEPLDSMFSWSDIMQDTTS